MVDKEKIRKRKQKGGSPSGDDKSIKDSIKESKKKKSGSSSSATNRSSTPNKGDDIKPLLFAVANMDMFGRTLSEYGERDVSGNKASILDDVSSEISSKCVDFMGVFDIPGIADSNGYDWKEILQHLSTRKDITGSKYRDKGGNPTKQQVKDSLDCIANMILYVEGNVRALEDKNDMSTRDEVSLDVYEVVHEQYKKIISTCEVQRIAEKNGYSWKEDIIKGVLEDQDIEEMAFE